MDKVEHVNLLADGTVTVELTNGKHFTYRIKTVRKGSLEGKRIVSLMIGPDNENSFKGFGFVHPVGVDRIDISLWRKTSTEAFIKHRKLLMGLAQEHVNEWLQEARCRACGRKLTTPESIRLGIGPECGKRG